MNTVLKDGALEGVHAGPTRGVQHLALEGVHAGPTRGVQQLALEGVHAGPTRDVCVAHSNRRGCSALHAGR